MATLTPLARVQALWRRGWVEIPEIMASAGIGALGVCLSIVGYIRKESQGGWSQKYMLRPMILRPDDPRLKKVQTYSNLDP